MSGYNINDIHQEVLDTTDLVTGYSPYLNEPVPGAFYKKFGIAIADYLEWLYGPFEPAPLWFVDTENSEVVEAIRLDSRRELLSVVVEWTQGVLYSIHGATWITFNQKGRDHVIYPGNYLVKKDDGEFVVMKSDVFWRTHKEM